ncbi:MAG: TlpA family protein disulfide reductase [Bacteroidetes bacterium]|nr:TlpA family protein disulfide reductase [Bacteroidota bacterium]
MPRMLFPLVVFLILAPLTAVAQSGPVAGQSFTVVYNPTKGSPFTDAVALDLVYVFDIWNFRHGTRLALWQNVLRPDTARVRFARMRKSPEGWTAEISIPEDAALLSYYVTDGRHMDGNNQKTYVRYVLNENNTPVQNARYYNIPFLRMAREPLGLLVREAEREISDYPENFRAYHQYFKLLLEQGKGSPRTQERIANRIAGMEKEHGENPDFLNMAAETWFYILQDAEKALEYRNRIPTEKMWPQVFRIFNREEKMQQERERLSHAENRRKELQDAELPAFNLRDAADEKVAFPRQDGRPMLLVFWASASERSQTLLTALKNMPAAAGLDRMHVVTVCLDTEQETGIAWFREHGMPFELLFNQGSALQMLGVDSIPILYLVDSEGIIRSILVGYAERQHAALQAMIQRLAQ